MENVLNSRTHYNKTVLTLEVLFSYYISMAQTTLSAGLEARYCANRDSLITRSVTLENWQR